MDSFFSQQETKQLWMHKSVKISFPSKNRLVFLVKIAKNENNAVLRASEVHKLLRIFKGLYNSILLVAPSVRNINTRVNPGTADLLQHVIKQLEMITFQPAAKFCPRWIIQLRR